MAARLASLAPAAAGSCGFSCSPVESTVLRNMPEMSTSTSIAHDAVEWQVRGLVRERELRRHRCTSTPPTKQQQQQQQQRSSCYVALHPRMPLIAYGASQGRCLVEADLHTGMRKKAGDSCCCMGKRATKKSRVLVLPHLPSCLLCALLLDGGRAGTTLSRLAVRK